MGRVSTGLFRIYVGDITSAEPSSPPDVDIVLKSKTGNASSGDVVSKSAQALSKLSQIAAGIASDVGATLDFQALDKLIANYTYTGGALGQINRLAEAGGVRAFLDDDRLIVQDFGKATAGRVKVLNLNSGLVGIPKANDKGVDVTYLIDGESVLGGKLILESKFNRALNAATRLTNSNSTWQATKIHFSTPRLCSRL
ncbi:baseplate hub protein [Bordetella avium]|uniref:baseplate hub protein n=1 Tax=Bordetella avium TaxID=521 RepID=UPI003F87F6D3